MSLSTVVSTGTRMRIPGIHSNSVQPLGAGLVAILVIAAAILILGDSQAQNSVVSDVGIQHEGDLLRFTETLHYSSVNLSGPGVHDNLDQIASSSAFNTSVQRALFGLRAQRMDIYNLQGDPIYSTRGQGNAPILSGKSLDAFSAARSGQFVSFLRGDLDSRTEVGSDSEMLQSFALVYDVPPDSLDTGRALMVVSITSSVADELDAAYSTVWTVVAIFFFGSLVILSVVYWASVRSQDRLQRANDALAEQYVAVRESRERMIAAADATKRAIAEELHGSVQTRLFSIWARLTQLTSGPDGDVSRADLTPLIDEIDDVREHDIRGLSHRLHPSIVRVGAVPALRSLCERMSGDLKVDLELHPAAKELEPIGASPIPEPVRLAVYRIAELAIGNTVKHASAKYCRVSWLYSEMDAMLRLIVEDDGVGFDPDALTKSEFGGLGIVNIQDYTDSINGTAMLKSEPGWGTTLTVNIPFSLARPESSDESAPSSQPGNVTPFSLQKAA